MLIFFRNERQELDRRREARLNNDESPRFGWTEYYTLQEIYDYFDELAGNINCHKIIINLIVFFKKNLNFRSYLRPRRDRCDRHLLRG